ncbi:Ras GTPase [Planoprotostelium fungivorum]|uniref:small monomeric GTPase n=1 Tax=Planoprotostelium fungivorum TaxID=1890364 RepID=A0A2P6NWX1_9EUKA|nr:Ras GTPase [Planoprotostelium fungivorum]
MLTPQLNGKTFDRHTSIILHSATLNNNQTLKPRLLFRCSTEVSRVIIERRRKAQELCCHVQTFRLFKLLPNRGERLPEMMYKIVVLGDGGVGKSALVIQLTQNYFTVEYDPTIENNYRKQISVDDDTCMLDIQDTAGQEEFSAARATFLRTGEGFIVVYSVISEESFLKIHSTVQDIYKNKEQDQFPVVIVGNKCDMEKDREVLTSHGRDYANGIGAPFFESSAKSRINVEEPFIEMVRVIRRYQGKSKDKVTAAPVKKAKDKKERRCILI